MENAKVTRARLQALICPLFFSHAPGRVYLALTITATGQERPAVPAIAPKATQNESLL